jgi:hypothetical protein
MKLLRTGLRAARLVLRNLLFAQEIASSGMTFGAGK